MNKTDLYFEVLRCMQMGQRVLTCEINGVERTIEIPSTQTAGTMSQANTYNVLKAREITNAYFKS